MTNRDYQLSRAYGYWERGAPLPLDIFYALLGAGIDVEAAEKRYLNAATNED